MMLGFQDLNLPCNVVEIDVASMTIRSSPCGLVLYVAGLCLLLVSFCPVVELVVLASSMVVMSVNANQTNNVTVIGADFIIYQKLH
jgi:hypothetical protein